MHDLLTPPDKSVLQPPLEKLIPLKAAAEVIGVPTWKLSRAAKQGVIPTYSVLNSRRLVKLSEVVAIIEASRRGGGA